MSTEITQDVEYKKVGKWLVSNELFLDLIFNSACNCNCPFCISRTKNYAKENFENWINNLYRTFEIFKIKNIIILGGEATVDKQFFEKINILESVIEGKSVDNVILTTNGLMLREPAFLKKLINSCVNTVNISVMHYDKEINDNIMGSNTLSKEELIRIYRKLKDNGKTMRLNVNVYKGNCDTVSEMKLYADTYNGCADIIKFSPLMKTDMFNTVDSVTEWTRLKELTHNYIENLYDEFASACEKVVVNEGVFGLIKYKEVDYNGQKIMLKYAQVEDTYDLDKVIPTLKLYCNGALSNEWNYNKNILNDM